MLLQRKPEFSVPRSSKDADLPQKQGVFPLPFLSHRAIVVKVND